MDKKNLRSIIFQHLDGVAITPIIIALSSKNILEEFHDSEEISLDFLAEQYHANNGYLNVALRALASQGFLDYRINNAENLVFIKPNSKTKFLLKNASVYQELGHYFKIFPNHLDETNSSILQNVFKKYQNHFGIQSSENELEREVQKQILHHAEGVLAAPIIVQLAMKGMFHKYFMESSFQAGEFHKNPEHFEIILDFLQNLGWFTKNGSNYKFTEKGEYFAKRAASYGVTVSYMPMFNRLEELIFDDPKKIRQISENEDEIHVDRKMNVWGSGGAHSTYFKIVTDFITEIFNQPLETQPKGILDMGCGNGAFIQHIFETIERHTLRGKNLENYPLFLVGADYNQAALKVTRANLINADIWAKVIWGDIGNPQKLAEDLKENYTIELSDLLNIRTFLDHNRIWSEPKSFAGRISSSTGAFAHQGKRLANAAVEENLKEHLQNWLPYIRKYGLLVIELHTISPEITSKNLGKTAATAYDATHGFSDQYILEIEVFHKICEELGLKVDSKLFKKYPDSELATVSINLLKNK